MRRATVAPVWPGGSVVASLSAASRWRATDHDEVQAFVRGPAGPMFTTAFHPRAARRGTAFLLCHSFAWEQAELSPLELLFARRAASRGFPVLSFHASGYGDTGGDFAEVTLDTQARDARVAAELLASWDDVERVVPVGARWGASVAAMTASAIGAEGLVLWNPAIEPGRYLDGLLKVKSMAGMMDGGGVKLAALKQALLVGTTIDLLGYPVTAACYRDAHATDPLETSRPSQALVVSVNPGARRQAERAGERLQASGAAVRLQDAQGDGRSGFGLGMPLSGHLATYLDLFGDIADRTLAWAGEVW